MNHFNPVSDTDAVNWLQDLVELIKNCSNRVDALKTAVEAQRELFRRK